MTNTAQVPQELYEQVKAQVLEEIKATNKAKANARAKAREEVRRQEAELQKQENADIEAAFKLFKSKYTPLLAARYERVFMSGGKSLYDKIQYGFNTAIDVGLRTVGIHSLSGAYRLGKLDEVIKTASDVLDVMVKN